MESKTPEQIILKDDEIKNKNYLQILSNTLGKWTKKRWLKIISLISLLIIFTIIGAILGVIAFSRTDNYYLEYNGKMVYCKSTIWMRVEVNTNKDEKISGPFCSYKDKSKDDYDEKNAYGDIIARIKYKKWNGQYSKGYFEYEKRD